jgi:hypothetical protein
MSDGSPFALASVGAVSAAPGKRLCPYNRAGTPDAGVDERCDTESGSDE